MKKAARTTKFWPQRKGVIHRGQEVTLLAIRDDKTIQNQDQPPTSILDLQLRWEYPHSASAISIRLGFLFEAPTNLGHHGIWLQELKDLWGK